MHGSQDLRHDVDAAEEATAAAAVEHERVLVSLLAMHDQRLSATQQQADAQLAALLTEFNSCAAFTLRCRFSLTDAPT
jgi:hypothetical protein